MLMLKTACTVTGLAVQKAEDGQDLFRATCENVAHYPDGVEILCPDTDDDRECRIVTQRREFRHLHHLKGFPAPAGQHSAFERHAARALHLFLIAATVLMPLTGILRSLAYARPVAVFGIPMIPRLFERKQDALYAVSAGLHDSLAVVRAGAIGLPIAAALKHALLDRDGTLARMLGRSERGGNRASVPRRSGDRPDVVGQGPDA